MPSDLSRKIAEAIVGSQIDSCCDEDGLADLIDRAGVGGLEEKVRVNDLHEQRRVRDLMEAKEQLAQFLRQDERRSTEHGELLLERDALAKRIEAAVALHEPSRGRDGYDECRECHLLLPCPTVRILRGEEENEMAAYFSELIAEREDLRFRLSDAEARIEAAVAQAGTCSSNHPCCTAVRILRGEEESAPPYLTSGTIWELAPDALEAARREEEEEGER